jgi:hypothetical protein
MPTSLAFVSLPRSVSARDRWRRGSFLDVADTLPQRRLEVDRPAVLVQQIGDGFIGELPRGPCGTMRKRSSGESGQRSFDGERQPNILTFADSQGLSASAITHALNSPINKEDLPREYLFEQSDRPSQHATRPQR